MEKISINLREFIKSKKNLAVAVTVIILILLFVEGVVYFKNKNSSIDIKSKQMTENTTLLKAVARLIIIPDEQPIIATINQADILVKEQAFYAGSQNGDKLIIFPKAQKAIIYSSLRNIIVNSGPFVINSGTSPQSKSDAK